MTDTILEKPARGRGSLTDAELLKAATEVVKAHPLGLLTTVSLGNAPHARWMVAAMGDKCLHHLYCLTGRWSRKVVEIAARPAVCWVFSSPQHNEVVTITGRATLLPTLSALQGRNVAWAPLMKATYQYAITAPADLEEPELTAVETEVDHVELISPRLGIYLPCTVPLETPAAASVNQSGLDI